MTVIVYRNSRWLGVDYAANQSVTNRALEQNMVNAGFAKWAPGSAPRVPAGAVLKLRDPDTLAESIADLQALANSVVGVAGAYNWKSSNTKNITRGAALARSGLGRFRNVFMADSFFTGTDSLSAALTNALRYGWISQSEERFRQLGYNASESWGFGDRGAPSLAESAGLDPRLEYGGTTGIAPNWYSLSGWGWDLAGNVPTASVGFTPRDAFDRMECLYLTGSAGVGSFSTENQAGVAGGTVNTLTGNGVAVVEHSVPAGSTKAIVRSASAARSIVYGMGTRDSTKMGIELLNCGRSGGDLLFFLGATTGNGFAGARVAIGQLMLAAPHANCVHLGGGYNDTQIYGKTQIQVEAYTREQLTVQRSLAAAPDVVWHIYGPLNSAYGASAAFNNMLDAQIRIAIDEFDACVIDHRKTFDALGAELLANGYLANGIHFHRLGQEVMSSAFVRCMTQRYS